MASEHHAVLPRPAGFFVGFAAGIIGAKFLKQAEHLIGTLPLPAAHQWLARAVAYSGLPAWKSLLARTASKLPARRGMINAYLHALVTSA